MRIEASCRQCGRVAETTFWSRAVTHGALHEHQPVRVVALMTSEEWRRKHRDSKGRAADGTRTVLHLDSDGSTILIPVEVRS